MTEKNVLLRFWAKSDAGGNPHSLVAHLLDTAAVAEIIWEEFLAPTTKRQLDETCDGHGRQTYVLTCALHDIGKASPAFQRKAPDLARLLKDYLPLSLKRQPDDQKWHHTKAGARFLAHLLDVRFPYAGTRERWVEAIVLGHHGRVTEIPCKVPISQRDEQRWETTQTALVDLITQRLGIDLKALISPEPPTRALQLALAGYVVMADWIASSSEFPGIGLRDQSMEEARRRARKAWDHLGFSAGWQQSHLTGGTSSFVDRFGFEPRPLQRLVAETALSMTSPGLMIVEAPMGEGKTEAGEFATEILADRFGCDGFVFAMPTQGTTDAMYARVIAWVEQVDPSVPVTLLHGKAMLNETWLNLLQQDSEELSDIYGDEDDPYGLTPSTRVRQLRSPSAWLLGRNRQLLSPLIVATIDQILRAAVRSKFVMLRHAGLSGKVVIVDEVHSYDVYMSVFLHELLRWCAGMGIPVILMSATLPPALRAELAESYASKPVEIPSSDAYPVVTTVLADSSMSQSSCQPFRQDSIVEVSLLTSSDPSDTAVIADAIDRESRDGGCVLAIVNTVGRAQHLYRQLHDRGVPTKLLHGRLTAAARADRTAELVDVLGSNRRISSGRPERLAVVATQIAEQSFDVDADLLFTDIAPTDLLLQRVGRLHRHDRPASDRPAGLRSPRMIITGVALSDTGEPSWPKGFDYVYDRWTLLASAHLLRTGTAEWAIPSDIPRLVAAAYGHDWEAESVWPVVAAAWQELRSAQTNREEQAKTYVLGSELRPGSHTLEGLHYQTAADSDEYPAVRDGEPTREVCLVVSRDESYWSLAGRPLGPNGERCADPKLARHVLGDCVRVRESEDLGKLGPLPAWVDMPLLAWQEVLILDENRQVRVNNGTVSYDDEFGLVIDRDGR